MAGLITVVAGRANGHGEFSAAAELVQLSFALEQLQTEVGNLPMSPESNDFKNFVTQVYGKQTSANPKLDDLDRNELVTFLLNIDTWPIEKPAERSNFVFFEFREDDLFDKDGDGWLEYCWREDRVFVYRNGEIALYDEETRLYQFAE